MLGPAGCGFRPLYGPGEGASELRGAVAFGEPESTAGFSLVRALEGELGTPVETRFRLSVRARIEEEGGGITTTQETERFSLLAEADYTLGEAATGENITAGNVRAFTSYSASGTPIATRAARDDAVDRLMAILAEQIVARLAAALA